MVALRSPGMALRQVTPQNNHTIPFWELAARTRNVHLLPHYNSGYDATEFDLLRQPYTTKLPFVFLRMCKATSAVSNTVSGWLSCPEGPVIVPVWNQGGNTISGMAFGGPTVDSNKVEHVSRMKFAGGPSFFKLGLEGGHVPTFWLLL